MHIILCPQALQNALLIKFPFFLGQTNINLFVVDRICWPDFNAHAQVATPLPLTFVVCHVVAKKLLVLPSS